MKNKCLLLVSALCTSALAQQKMELKPSVTVAPFTYNQVGLASGFSNANAGTTDLFGKNGKNDFGIPSNYMGSQDAAESDNYFGIITYKGDREIDLKKIGDGGIVEGKPVKYKYSEYVQVALPQALAAGKEYELVFKISLADNSAYATKGFGAYFTDNKVSNSSNRMLNVTPQINYPDLVTDKGNWTELKGKFKATGSEKYVTIGCFENNFSAEKVDNGKSFGTVRAYYYVSAISIAEASLPDRDKDGIADKFDACPDVPGLEKFAGCPDSDNDGIVDSKDECPQVAGLASLNGCPDGDGDGITDSKDKCPTVAGLASNNGCPEVKIDQKAKEVFQKAMSGIQFESGKDIIKKTSYPVLDNVAAVLKENPSWNVEVQGHTDNAGKYEANKVLSQKRAEAVEKYLSEKGVDVSKLTPVGYGSDKPIADNKTAAGKAKNRRVEFNVTYIQ